MVHDPGKAGARSWRGLVDTLPQRLKVIGDDDDFSDNASMKMPTKDNSQSENLQSYSKCDVDQNSEELNRHHCDCC